MIKHPISLDPSATYLVVGGLGGLGLDIIEFLAAHGARHAAIFCRSGYPKQSFVTASRKDNSEANKVWSSKAEKIGTGGKRVDEAKKRLRKLGVEVYIHAVDICEALMPQESAGAAAAGGTEAQRA